MQVRTYSYSHDYIYIYTCMYTHKYVYIFMYVAASIHSFPFPLWWDLNTQTHMVCLSRKKRTTASTGIYTHMYVYTRIDIFINMKDMSGYWYIYTYVFKYIPFKNGEIAL